MNIEIPDMPEMNFDFPDAPPTPLGAPNTPTAPKVKVYTYRGMNDMKWAPEADMAFRSAERAQESAATAKKEPNWIKNEPD
ncbi:hypothetical protein [Chryseobacterium wanjuense]